MNLASRSVPHGMRRIGRGRITAALLVAAAAAAATLLVAGWRQTRDVRLVPVTIRLARLPRSFEGYRILHLSCLHVGGAGILERRLLALLSGQRFDLAVIAGDFRDSRASLEGTLAGLRPILGAIRARDGVFGCEGNHDTVYLLRALREEPIRVLLDQSVTITRGGESILLAGTSGSLSESALARLVAGAHGGTFTILAGHNPDVALPASRAGVDLVLCGDTHGGQVVLPLLGPALTKTSLGPRFVYGLNALGRTWVYTNPGIGTTGVHFRLGRPPEATVLTLRRAVP